MIRSCRDKDVSRLLNRQFSRRLQSIEKTARIRLELLDAAISLKTSGCRVLGWRRSRATGGDNTAFGSTINIVFVLNGVVETPTMSKSSITTNNSGITSLVRSKHRRLPPIHPGEVLKNILDDASLSANVIALALRVPANRISAILKGERGITGDTALRLSRYFRTSAQMWMNLQAKYDLALAEDTSGKQIEREVQPRHA